ncbi:MAG: hypothetical protein LUD50_06735 [Clostridia bacterium]|nr:hypothetical protein [Clostridia bacterium]
MAILEESIFNNFSSPLFNNVEVFISDNAQTLNAEDYDSRYVHIFKNKNAGGSGGFTRTMIEVNNANERGDGFTHILLMDDDVIFDPESIYRTYSILALLKPEYIDAFVGGAMFFADKQYMQYANGEYWHDVVVNNKNASQYITKFNFRMDMRRIKDVCKNEELTNSNYQAWWFCAVPMSICRKDNLGLPLFIKSDDIEYGIRNLKDLILLNGINIWHASFDAKYLPSNEYYAARNYLIITSVHGSGLTKEFVKTYAKSFFIKYAVNFKYVEANLFFDAVDDFLNGVDYLKSIDPESYHSKISQGAYDCVDVSEISLPFSRELYDKTLATPYPKSKIRRLFRILTLNGLLLPSRKVIALGMWGGTNIQTFRAKYIIRYEPSTNKAFVVKRSLRKFLSVYRRYRKTLKKIDKMFMQVRDEYYARANELENIEFWADMLELNCKDEDVHN